MNKREITKDIIKHMSSDEIAKLLMTSLEVSAFLDELNKTELIDLDKVDLIRLLNKARNILSSMY